MSTTSMVTASSNDPIDEPKTQWVFHVKQSNFIEDVIYPLNSMQELPLYKDIFDKHIKKYEGRDVDKVWIDQLNCGWHDVIFLSTINPFQDYQSQLEAGLAPEPREYFCIPISDLEELPAVVWEPPSLNGISRFATEFFSSLHISNYQQKNEVPEHTKAYYRDCANEEIKPKTFHTHIIVKGPIDISTYPIIKWEDVSSSVFY